MEDTTVISSNFSAREILNIANHVARTNLELAMVEALKRTIEEKGLVQDNVEMYERRLEILEEQVSFARNLLDSLEAHLKDSKSLREFRKVFNLELENTSFER